MPIWQDREQLAEFQKPTADKRKRASRKPLWHIYESFRLSGLIFDWIEDCGTEYACHSSTMLLKTRMTL